MHVLWFQVSSVLLQCPCILLLSMHILWFEPEARLFFFSVHPWRLISMHAWRRVVIHAVMRAGTTEQLHDMAATAPAGPAMSTLSCTLARTSSIYSCLTAATVPIFCNTDAWLYHALRHLHPSCSCRTYVPAAFIAGQCLPITVGHAVSWNWFSSSGTRGIL